MHAPREEEPKKAGFAIAIIGAGFAGIGMAIRLKKAGIHSFTLFERSHEIGGTWRDNSYPGAACDVPSHVYSLSFEQNPNWSGRYAGSGEIQEHLLSLVEKWDLRAHLQLNTAITEARFHEKTGTWALTTDQGKRHLFRVVVSGVGGLVDPSYPDIKGLDSFNGTQFHTARWNHDYDLKGKRMAIIGTGASAVQVVPTIASQVKQLLVFQRTAAWVVRKWEKDYSTEAKRRLVRFPKLMWLFRFVRYWLSELLGTMVFFNSKRLSSIGERLSRAHLKAQVKDPELRKKLTPSFQFGCKRVLLSDDYWATFERDNVELVTDQITEITPDGIKTADGRSHVVDGIILATGFDLGLATAPFPITGLGDKTLDEAWRDGAFAYKGMTVTGFPNWFILMGPNTGPGHTSVLIYTEAQINHTLQAIKTLQKNKIKYLDIRQEIQDRYNANIQARMKHTAWLSGCQSWYLSEDGINRTLYPGFATEYVLKTRKLKLSDYEVVSF
jgi:cation diffusion facilitator CzcD-associated flavoprotein CzcO